MKVRGLAFLLVTVALVAPLVTAGGPYLRFLRAARGWVASCAFLSFAGIHFVLRRVAELGLRRPGAALRAAAVARREERT
jgi:hypothetical protein